jgi:hypothetical protein
MTSFEYVSVLISIIIGLGIAHILMGWGQMLSGHRRYRTDWVHALWMANILLYMIFFWWFTFKWVNKPDWSFALFLFTIGYAILIYLLAVVLVPHETEVGFDFPRHFKDKRILFFSGCLTILIVDLIDAFLKGPENVASHGYLGLVYSGTMIGGTLGAIFSSREWYHRVFAVVWFVVLASWALFSMGATSDIRGVL